MKLRDELRQYEVALRFNRAQTERSEIKDAELAEITRTIDSVQSALQSLDNQSENLISSGDIFEMMKSLKQKITKAEAEEMVYD